MTFKLHTSDDKNDDANDDAVLGIMTTGSGFSHLEQLTASLDVTCMPLRKYQATHNKMFNLWEDNAVKVLKKAAEKKSALTAEDVSADDILTEVRRNTEITVIYFQSCDSRL
ncbi:hypothetical protein ILUMI_14198 [Ignelater luminosus]|uniref:Mutator-like transposase domain-containing protein n=1 Tax=Ignelater luminosus TaxID=2038154 RepID=A0A8K0G529_IGNLU|nr:hypothetical protein ILUMI_14198 [Ignelater luminosus]